ncbi:MAG: alpha-amylase family glycosyl hydrolase [Actinomycetaceae bacterium]|nr:alpha-amylase family glycosyl hydrolase [Actinomycetaceae bacterium]
MSKNENKISMWHIYPLGALDDDRTLADLVPWLDYAQELGCNAIALGPIFLSSTHGYDTLDHYQIDPRLGTRDDFDRFLQAAHSRDMKVILDGVFNHVGRNHPAVVQARKEGADSSSPWKMKADYSPLKRGEEPYWYYFEGHDTLITLDHTDHGTRNAITQVMNYWLEAGIDGWRLDAAYALEPEHWAQILQPVRQRFPHAWIVAEVIHGEYAQMAKLAGWDSLTQYELWKAIWSSLNDANFFELDWTLKRHGELCQDLLPMTFISNHDVTRIASKLDCEDHVGLAVALLATLPGQVSVYYGDEVGFSGVKEDRPGGDDAVRQALPATPEQMRTNDRAQRYWHWYASLLYLRRTHPWLQSASISVEHLDHTILRYRCSGENDSLVVVLNAGNDPFSRSESFLCDIGEVLAGQFDASEDGEVLRANAYLIGRTA